MAADVSTKADLPSAWLIRFSPYLKSGTRVLEIASGNGRNTRFLAGLGCDVDTFGIGVPFLSPFILLSSSDVFITLICPYIF